MYHAIKNVVERIIEVSCDPCQHGADPEAKFLIGPNVPHEFCNIGKFPIDIRERVVGKLTDFIERSTKTIQGRSISVAIEIPKGLRKPFVLFLETNAKPRRVGRQHDDADVQAFADCGIMHVTYDGICVAGSFHRFTVSCPRSPSSLWTRVA